MLGRTAVLTGSSASDRTDASSSSSSWIVNITLSRPKTWRCRIVETARSWNSVTSMLFAKYRACTGSATSVRLIRENRPARVVGNPWNTVSKRPLEAKARLAMPES